MQKVYINAVITCVVWFLYFYIIQLWIPLKPFVMSASVALYLIAKELKNRWWVK
jgi:hypothetical protein